MTEELTPEFEMFSQMLDAEEPIGRDLTDDEQVLVDLRRVLQDDVQSAPLSESFARETENLVKERYGALSPGERLFDRSRSHLTSPLFRPSGLLKGLGLTAGVFGLAAASFKALAVFGVALLLFSFGWLRKERLSGNPGLGRPGTISHLSRRMATGLFYLMPFLVACSTALMAAATIGLLGQFSISFRESSGTVLVAFQIFVSVGIGVLFTKACLPVWKAYQARATTEPIRLALFQLTHAVLLGTLLYGLTQVVTTEKQPRIIGAVMILAAVFVVVVAVSNRYLEAPDEVPSFASARRTAAVSLVMGFTPIVLVLLAAYQMHLTREITEGHPSREFVVREVGLWVASQSAIPESENGWMVLRPFLLRDEREKPENAVTAEKLDGFWDFYDDNARSYHTLKKEERARYNSRKQDFLSVLPLLETALDKPYFSPIATQGFSLQSQAPNYTTYRSVSQGLGLLTQEALAQDMTDDALDHIELGLRWARKEESGSLISLMIEIAQMAITHDGLEKAVVSGKFSDAQLNRLSEILMAHIPERHEFGVAMMGETVLTDTALNDFIVDTVDPKLLDQLGLPPFLRFLPKSYWESERNAYWNFQLAQVYDWRRLTDPRFDTEQDINPMNLSTSFLTTFTGRAMVQFCYLHSKYASLIVMCELEQYKIKHGEYPESLESIFVGDYTIDLMDRRALSKKRPFRYERAGTGYRLISESPWYPEIGLGTKQVYGHDGDLMPNR
jgi:hypothetical protein